MAKKPEYDVVKRFQEVAKRAKEVGPIHTGPSKTKPKPEPVESVGKLKESFANQHGAIPKGKDVNLPIETASSEVKDRMAKLRAMRKH